MKKWHRFLAAALVCVLFCSCGTAEPKQEKETVSLRVWGAEVEQECLQQMVDQFKEKYKDEAEFDIHIGTEDADNFKTNYLKNVENSADVFAFVNDQLYELVFNNSLLPITWEKEEVMEENGGAGSSAVQSAMCDGGLYAYPMTASNGYFLYYNDSYYDSGDVEQFDRILEIAEKEGKKVYMDWSSGWYIYSFFGGAGFDLNLSADRKTNECNWNGENENFKGTDVAEAMLRISASDAFFSGDNDAFRAGVEKGEIIAGVSGTWNVDCVSKSYGEHYAAAKMPCYTIAGKQVQMKSFSGYKLVGVNATTKFPEWAQKLARFITNEENQTLRFQVTGEGPSNRKAAETEQVQASPAIVALSDQSEFSIVQNVGEHFWDAATEFGMVMVSGNKDGLDLQELLDELVKDAA